MQNAPCLLRIHEEKDICTICSKPFKWSKRNWVKGEMIEVEFVTAHAGCRVKMREFVERKKQLQDEITNIEWEMYKLCNPLLINGTYFIDKY